MLVGLGLGLGGDFDSVLAGSCTGLALRQSCHHFRAFVDIFDDLLFGVGDELATVFFALT